MPAVVDKTKKKKWGESLRSVLTRVLEYIGGSSWVGHTKGNGELSLVYLLQLRRPCTASTSSLIKGA